MRGRIVAATATAVLALCGVGAAVALTRDDDEGAGRTYTSTTAALTVGRVGSVETITLPNGEVVTSENLGCAQAEVYAGFAITTPCE
jgi:hypothetical protein